MSASSHEQTPTAASIPLTAKDLVSVQPVTQATIHFTEGVLPIDPGDWPQIPGHEILGELGRGGMGVVYKARQLRLNRLVAIKMILGGVSAGAVERQRFLTEAEAVARLHHPNIVQIYEIGEHEGRPFFSLEFCAGGSLAEQLKGTPIPAENAAQLIQTLARAMQHAHDAGVVHRDLKPANVLFTRHAIHPESGSGSGSGSIQIEQTEQASLLDWRDRGQGRELALCPKITDFGLARKLDESSQTQAGTVMGTPSYMSPEQAQGDMDAIGPATDVYALGAIFYECLTGRPPFRAATAFETVMQVIHEEPVSPSQLQPGLPRDLVTIVHKCLQKEPRRRYSSATELADDLHRWLDGEPIKARPVGPMTRFLRWTQKNPLVAGLLAMVALSVMFSFLNLRTSLASVAALARRNQQLLAESVAVRLDERIHGNIQAVAFLSREREIRELLTAPGQKREPYLLSVQEVLQNILLSNQDFSSAFVLDQRGRALASTNPAHPGHSFAFRDYFQKAIQGEVYQSKILVGTTTGKAGMYYSAPVRQGDKILGVVVIKFESERLERIISHQDVGDRGVAMLVDEDGIVIAHRDRDKVFRSIRALSDIEVARIRPGIRFRTETIESIGNPALEVLVGATTSGFIDYVDPEDGSRRTLAYAPLHERSWVVATDLDTRDFSWQGSVMAWRSGLGILLLGGILMAVLFRFARRRR